MKTHYETDLIRGFLNRVLIGLLLIVVLALPASLIRVADHGLQIANVLHIIGSVFILLTWRLRKRLSLKAFGLMIVADLSFIAFPGMISYGFASAAATFGVFTILLITIVWNKKYGLVALVAYVLFILAIGYGFIHGNIAADFDFSTYLHTPSAWGAVFVVIIIQTYVFITAIGAYDDRIWALQKEVQYKSEHDFLTDLFNREKLYAELSGRVGTAGSNRFSLFFLDLDGFKGINDIHGHVLGDFVLKKVSERLKQLFHGGLLARYGGDEFTAIMETDSESEIRDLCEKTIQAITAPIICKGAELSVGISIGVAVYPAAGATLDDLKRSADRAMYKVKESGKNSYHIQQES